MTENGKESENGGEGQGDRAPACEETEGRRRVAVFGGGRGGAQGLRVPALVHSPGTHAGGQGDERRNDEAGKRREGEEDAGKAGGRARLRRSGVGRAFHRLHRRARREEEEGRLAGKHRELALNAETRRGIRQREEDSPQKGGQTLGGGIQATLGGRGALRRLRHIFRKDARAEHARLLLQQDEGGATLRAGGRAYKERPSRGREGVRADRGGEGVPNAGRAEGDGFHAVRGRQDEEGVPFLLPHGAAQERHFTADMGRGVGAGRIHKANIPSEEDGGAGVHGHKQAGGGLNGGAQAGRRAGVRRGQVAVVGEPLHQGVGVARRRAKGDNVPLRQAHIRSADARHRDGHLHRFKTARTSGAGDNADLRQGAGQEQAEGGGFHTKHRGACR